MRASKEALQGAPTLQLANIKENVNLPSVCDIPFGMSSFHPRLEYRLPTNSGFRTVDQATASYKSGGHMSELCDFKQERNSICKRNSEKGLRNIMSL